jgi:hypothetical protein
VVVPSLTPGRLVVGRVVRIVTPVQISTWSPSPATSMSCRSARCTATTGGADPSGSCSQRPSGRRTPNGGTVVAIASTPPAPPSPSDASARSAFGHSSTAARPGRSRSARSSSVTRQPVRANAPAAARPDMPAPTTTAVRAAT